MKLNPVSLTKHVDCKSWDRMVACINKMFVLQMYMYPQVCFGFPNVLTRLNNSQLAKKIFTLASRLLSLLHVMATYVVCC